MSFPLSYTGTYSASTTYNQGDVVESGERLYVCLQNAVTGADPEASPASWQRFTLASPRGLVVAPEDYGAVGDGVIFTDGAIQTGSATLTSASLTSAARTQSVYVAGAGPSTSYGSTSAALSTGAPITSIPRTSGPAIPAGLVVISSGSHAQVFQTAGAAANTNVPVSSQTPNFAYPANSPLRSFGAGLSATITSAGAGTATLSAPATSTISATAGWFGTDDTAALQAALDALPVGLGGVVLLRGKNYVVASAPKTTRSGNAQISLPVDTTISTQVVLEGTVGTRILSTYTGGGYDASHGAPSLLGGPTSEGLPALYPTGGPVYIDRVEFWTPENPNIGALDLSKMAGAILSNLRVTTAIAFAAGPYGKIGNVPGNVGSFGVWMPNSQNGGKTSLSHVDCQGYYAGLLISDHCQVYRASAFMCTLGLGFVDGYSGGHVCALHYVDIEGYRYGLGGWLPQSGLRSLSSSTVYLDGLIDLEDWADQWFPVAVVTDANRQLIGRLRVNRGTFFGDLPTYTAGSARLEIRSQDPSVEPSYDDSVMGASGLVAYLPLSDSGGTVARDLSGNGRAGTYVTGPLQAVPGPSGDAQATSFKASASQYVSVQDLDGFGAALGSGTLEFWLKTTTATAQYPLGFASVNANVAGIGVVTNKDNSNANAPGTTKLELQSGTTQRNAHFVAPIYDGAWHHVVVQPSLTGTSAVWVDGVPVTVVVQTGAPSLGSLTNFDGPFAIGARDFAGFGGVSNFFDGRVARVAFYTSHLSSADIVQHYDVGVTR